MGCLCACRSQTPDKSTPPTVQISAVHEEKIRELQKERLAHLERAAEEARQRYQNGVVDYLSVLQVERNGLEAAVDMAEQPTERIAALQARLKNQQATVTLTRSLLQGGRGTELHVSAAEAALLEVRIALLRLGQSTD